MDAKPIFKALFALGAGLSLGLAGGRWPSPPDG